MTHVRSFINARDPSVDRRFRPRPDRQINLFGSIGEEETTDYYDDEYTAVSSTEHDTISTAASSCEGAQVYLRLKPITNLQVCSCYAATDNVLITRPPDSFTKNNRNEKHFTFTNVFDGSVGQASVYNACVRTCIEAEENVTVITYGTSGSGKTHTLLGDDQNPGIIPRALENIFTLFSDNIYQQPAVKVVKGEVKISNDDDMAAEQKLRDTLLGAESQNIQATFTKIQNTISREHNFATQQLQNKSVFVWISFAELYNEIVYDLLNPNFDPDLAKRKKLKILSNDGNVFIKDLTSVYVKSSREAYSLLVAGLRKVTYASTVINTHSSRSHCLFFIDVITYSHPDIFTQNTYKFCDLAGSERLKKTENVGTRLKEAQQINKSLLVLGRCLDAVYSNQNKKNSDVVPFRDSKLTTLLQTPLQGKEKITMIVNMTPIQDYYEENINALEFSSIAKNIVYKSNIQKKSRRTRYSWFAAQTTFGSPQNSKISNAEYEALLDENNRLRSELDRQLLKQETKLRRELVDEFEKIIKDRNDMWEKRLEQQEQSLKQMYEAKISLLEKRIEAAENNDEDESFYDEDEVLEVSLNEN